MKVASGGNGSQTSSRIFLNQISLSWTLNDFM